MNTPSHQPAVSTRRMTAALLLLAATLSAPAFAANDVLLASDADLQASASDAVGNLVILTRAGTPQLPLLNVQRFDAQGHALGAAVSIASASSVVSSPALARNAAGRFAVAWIADPQGSHPQVLEQSFDIDGTARGPALTVATLPQRFSFFGTDKVVAVGIDDAGNSAVAWSNLNRIVDIPVGDGLIALNIDSIRVQRVTASGKLSGAPLLVAAEAAAPVPGIGGVASPAVLMQSGGDFSIAWHAGLARGAVRVQRYAGTSGLRVGSLKTLQQTSDPALLRTLPDGRWFAVFEGLDAQGFSDIDAHMYSSAGAMQGSAFRVNTYSLYSQDTPTLASDARGDLAVAWNSLGQVEGISSGAASYDIFVQRFRADGSTFGGEFRANSYTSGQQTDPQALLDAVGNLQVIWTGDGAQGYGIYLHYFAAP